MTAPRLFSGGSQWTEPQGGPAISSGYLTQVAADDYQLTTDIAVATHGFNRVGDDWEIAALAELDDSLRLVRLGADTYRGF